MIPVFDDLLGQDRADTGKLLQLLRGGGVEWQPDIAARQLDPRGGHRFDQQRDLDPPPVFKRLGQIQPGKVGVGSQSSSRGDRLLNDRSGRERIDAGPLNSSGHVDSQGQWGQQFDRLPSRLRAQQVVNAPKQQPDQNPSKKLARASKDCDRLGSVHALLLIIPGMPDYFSGTGDDGTTGLLGSQRVPKFHPRPAATGALDEAAAALGLARALAPELQTRQVIVEIQRDLYHIMAEVAATRDQAHRFRELGADRVAWLEAEVRRIGDQISMPKGFVVGGDSAPGAALDLARTIVRRAERAIVELAHEGELDNPPLLAYLNRLSSLCFVLALWENRQAGVESPTLAKPEK